MFYVHESFKDVFVEAYKIHRTEGYRTLVVQWWNLGFTGNPWLLPVPPQKIKIQNKDWSQWKQFDPNVDVHPGRK